MQSSDKQWLYKNLHENSHKFWTELETKIIIATIFEKIVKNGHTQEPIVKEMADAIRQKIA